MASTSRIQLSPLSSRVRARVGDRTVADSGRVIRLEEPGYPVRLYFPRSEVADTVLLASDKTTHCPYKGDTRYFHIQIEGRQLDNAAWCYPSPIESMRAIAGHLAFDHPDIVIDEQYG
ncbi:MAG: DUF427 domain-containing protein [Salinisphaera sp.]|jgi:uncharacterized protein (DUF427 family)|nr:DUF427 domain-containing protein [Salinisphaera sp.]